MASRFRGALSSRSKGHFDSLTDPRFSALVDQDRQSAVARGVSQDADGFRGWAGFVETIIYDDLARAIDEALEMTGINSWEHCRFLIR